MEVSKKIIAIAVFGLFLTACSPQE
ncbi:MAG: Unknown protein, partial [uncultured Thiotrichaceae bacterium]